MAKKQRARDTWCRHRTGFDEKKHPVCQVGVDYHQFRKPSTHVAGVLAYIDMPCLGERPEDRARCSKYSAWTQEEIDQREIEIEQSLTRIGDALKAIRQATGGKRGVAGIIPCPACQKPLHYSVAGYNGHIHATCETQKCVCFQQ